jgi:hypothetical protein
VLTEPIYSTAYGSAYCGDARDLLHELDRESVDLIITSPPFPLLRQKTYGNEVQDRYVDWIVEFGRGARDVLKETGSFVLDLGGAYQRGVPVRSLYQYKVLIRFCEILATGWLRSSFGIIRQNFHLQSSGLTNGRFARKTR